MMLKHRYTNETCSSMALSLATGMPISATKHPNDGLKKHKKIAKQIKPITYITSRQIWQNYPRGFNQAKHRSKNHPLRHNGTKHILPKTAILAPSVTRRMAKTENISKIGNIGTRSLRSVVNMVWPYQKPIVCSL